MNNHRAHNLRRKYSCSVVIFFIVTLVLVAKVTKELHLELFKKSISLIKKFNLVK